ncbi:VWA domain-containing protein [Alienimonas californiensis]|uniref:von Willebrand factor type A domain protein n=1 Tax=Alienimonas californiensis TaxID=2527989 RepID=A0A517PA36_9PLAN|nr:VWA domain-containing protein [Alienimonas californiensis]QDT16225.1 von Willebrand factor type A domain protein [Alienimonas californiensis]
MNDSSAADLSAYALDLLRPEWLLGLALLPALWFLYRRSLVDFDRGQRIASLVVRSVVVVLLVLALAGLTLLRPTDERYVVFVADESLSVQQADGSDRVRTFLKSVGEPPAGVEAVVLPFAAEAGEPVSLTAYLAPRQDSQGDAPPGGDGEAGNQGEDGGDEGAKGTAIAAALRTALAAAPPDKVRRVVLLSDGNETAGDAVAAALAQAQSGRGDRIDVVPLPTRDGPEVAVSEVVVPAQVARGEPFFMEVAVDSNHADEVTVEVFRGPLKVVSEKQKLEPGENRFQFRQTVERDRLAEYTVRISGAKQDALVDNNAATGLVYAAGKPRVLLIDSAPDAARSFVWALGEEDVEVDVRPPRGVPEDVADLQNYEVIVLANVPATDLTSRQMEVMRTYVRDLGGGLMMLGGDQSFGLGGYYRSVLEEVLPVRSDFEKEKEKPSLAMVLIIDKSGSMGGMKMELAKDAAVAAVELLGAKDQLGVVAFDGSPTWVADIRPASDSVALTNGIASIGAGGGTSLYPAMTEARDALRRAAAKLKHVIILTDGQSSPGDFDGVTRDLVADRVTVSTVGVGQGADMNLLEQIAQTGGGRSYFSDDPGNIPQIFAKETVTASKSAINEEPFVPQVLRPTAALGGVDMESAPFLLGYVVTRPKATAEVILGTESGDPLLAWWRYGLGWSVAFTSDAGPRWAAEWLPWEGFGPFWAQILRHAMRKGGGTGTTVQMTRTGDSVRMILDAADPAGGWRNDATTEVTVIDPTLGSRTVPARQTAPGRYEAEFPVSTDRGGQNGAYHAEIVQSVDGRVVTRQSRGVTVGYPEELRLRPTNDTLLRAVASAGGGTFDPAPAEIFAPDDATAPDPLPLWPYLLATALALWLLDVALRRVDVPALWSRLRPAG